MTIAKVGAVLWQWLQALHPAAAAGGGGGVLCCAGAEWNGAGGYGKAACWGGPAAAAAVWRSSVATFRRNQSVQQPTTPSAVLCGGG